MGSLKEFVIAGTGQPEVLSLAECVAKVERIRLIGFIDDNKENASRNLYGYKLLGGFEFVVENPKVFVINSIARDADVRANSTARLKHLGAKFLNLIHPDAVVDVQAIGQGNIIDRYTILSRGSVVGSHNMFLTSVVIGHDCLIGDENFFGHKAVVSGHVVVGNQCFLAAQSFVHPNVRINDRTHIGPSAGVYSDTEVGSKYGVRPALRL